MGVMRVMGSQSRHRRMKSRNKRSSQPLRAEARSLLPGGPRYLPRLLRVPVSIVCPSTLCVTTQYRGIPVRHNIQSHQHSSRLKMNHNDRLNRKQPTIHFITTCVPPSQRSQWRSACRFVMLIMKSLPCGKNHFVVSFYFAIR